MLVSREAVELVLRAVRPSVRLEDGNLDLVVDEGTMLRVRLTGVCEGCPGFHAALSGAIAEHDGAFPPEGISLDDRLAEYEAGLIARALHASAGNKSRAAALLHVKRTTLADRISRHGARLRQLADNPVSGTHITRERRA